MNRPHLLPLLALLLLAACRPPRLQRTVDPTFPRRQDRSFALAPSEGRVLIREGLGPLPNGAMTQRVVEELGRHGFTPAPSGTADLWVAVHVLGPAPLGGQAGRPGRTGGRREGGEGGGGHGGRRGSHGSPEGAVGTESPSKGGVTLIVQLLDPHQGTVLWQGEGALEPGDQGPGDPAFAMGRLVHDLLEPLPLLRPN